MQKGGFDVDVLRQKTIIELLQKACFPPDCLRRYLSYLFNNGILTRDFLADVTDLFQKQGVMDMGCTNKLSSALVPCGSKSPIAGASTYVPSQSRFEQDFERLGLLGRGSYGEVWRCRSRIDGKEYAVKIVRYEFTSEMGHLNHPVLREVQTWANVQHSHAIRYHSAWVEINDGSTDAVPIVENSTHTLQSHEDLLEVSPRSVRSTDVWKFSEIDESSGGIVFEDSKIDSVAPQIVETVEPKSNGMQIVPYTKERVRAKRNATLYVQAELINGCTLQQWINRRNRAFAGTLSENERENWSRNADRIFAQLLSVVSHLHHLGIVHRDIKPANILLTENLHVKLGDFGLAKALQSSPYGLMELPPIDAPQIKGTDTYGTGTPLYASPEQHAGRSTLKSDVFSLGVVLAELFNPVQTQMERNQLLNGLREIHHGVTSDVIRKAESSDPESWKIVRWMTNENEADRPTIWKLVRWMTNEIPRDWLPIPDIEMERISDPSILHASLEHGTGPAAIAFETA